MCVGEWRGTNEVFKRNNVTFKHNFYFSRATDWGRGVGELWARGTGKERRREESNHRTVKLWINVTVYEKDGERETKSEECNVVYPTFMI